MADKTEIDDAPKNRRTVWADHEAPAFYANITGFSMTPFDITLQFGEIQSATAIEVKAIPRAKVIISPEQASSLLQLLDVALGAFVKGNGPLRTAGTLDVADLHRQVNESLKLGAPKAQ
jgi:hypothetical protein